MPTVRKLDPSSVDDARGDVLEQATLPDMDVPEVIPDGHTIDIISGKQIIRETPKELVRQRTARALFHQDGISYDDMEPDFSVTIDGKRRKIDIAIFHAEQPHKPENISRVVVCRPEPATGRGVIRLRDHQQAARDLDELRTIMEEIVSCHYGLWTNGLEFFYLKKKEGRFEATFEEIAFWPPASEVWDTTETVSRAEIYRADENMLRTAFRRCHDFIHGNEGMPKDAAFWQFLYLIFCKIYDERFKPTDRRFWIGATDQYEPEGRRRVRRNIDSLFSEVKEKYRNVFSGNEAITLSDRALAFMVSELYRYNFSRTGIDAKGAAYQEIVGNNLRGDRGQYFTPRGVVELAVEILEPKPDQKVLDPACGTGGFLSATLAYMQKKFNVEQKRRLQTDDTTEVFSSVNEMLSSYAADHIFGADFDPFLVRASQMNMVMSGDGSSNIFNVNSLEFPKGHLSGTERARAKIGLGTFDLVLTNPPFGSDIPITDRHILEQYELARRWESAGDGRNFRATEGYQGKVAPEVLFIERCVQWLKPGGRMGIVLPNGILGNPAAEYIRWWILQNTWVLASIELPVEVFIVDANVNILTSLLFLKKKYPDEILRGGLQEDAPYPIFMAVAENVGFDRRGNPRYKRKPDGSDIIKREPETETMRIRGRLVERTIVRPKRELDNDLPVIAAKYREFRELYSEPGR